MKQANSALWAILGIGGSAILFAAGIAMAQDEAAATTEVQAADPAAADPAAADPAAGEEGAEGEVAAPPAPPGISTEVKARGSDVLPLASRGLLLDVVNTGKRFVAVGTRGSILLSTSGKPAQWAQVQAPVRSPLTAVHFADEQNGWVVGHDAAILNTKDGGATWKLQNFQPELEKPFLDVLFLDAQNGYAVGAYGLFYRTGDGGHTWSIVEAPAIRGDELHFNAITKLANGHLFIAGEQGMLGISRDGGATWEKLVSPYEGSYFGALPVGAAGVMVFGLRGNIYINGDVAGSEWKKVATDSVVSLFGGTLLADGRAALAGINGTILLVDPASGAVREQRVKVREKDKVGVEREKIIASSFSTAVPLGSGDNAGLLLVGEEGVKTTALVQ